jgi:hypothetical protein
MNKRSKSQHKRVRSSQHLSFQPPTQIASLTTKPLPEGKFTIVDTLNIQRRRSNSVTNLQASFADLLKTKQQEKPQNVYTVYLIRVEKPQAGKRNWCVTKRYSEFHDLHKHVSIYSCFVCVLYSLY